MPTFSDPTIGRDREIAALAELLGRDDCRLVTLFGPAGVGKTRIAIAYAGGAASSYPDGVHWLPIGGLDDPESVITAISGALGVRAPAPGGTEEIVDHLRYQSCLVIIDNAEHQLPTSVALGQALLAEAPGVKIIFTSRHLTGIGAEQSLPVNPLPVPALGLSAEDVIMAPAAELFWTRTGLAGMPGDAQADALARICQRVDGLPLALEIAAARTTVLSIGELADTLEAELSILQLSGPHGDEALADAMVGWSHELLTPKEKLVFAQLAVFGGSFDRGAVAAVCGAGLSEVETVDVLASLVSKSLVARRDDGSRQARFRLLRLVRQYARTQLDRQDRTDELRRRHAKYFCALVEQAAPHLTTHDQQTWLATLDRRVGQSPRRDLVVGAAPSRARIPDHRCARPMVLPAWTLRRRPGMDDQRPAGLAGCTDDAAGAGAPARRHAGLSAVRLRGRDLPDDRGPPAVSSLPVIIRGSSGAPRGSARSPASRAGTRSRSCCTPRRSGWPGRPTTSTTSRPRSIT